MTDPWKGTRYEGTGTVRIVLPRYIVRAVEKTAKQRGQRYSQIVTKALVEHMVLTRAQSASN